MLFPPKSLHSLHKPLYLHNFQLNVQYIMEQSFIAYIENSIKENWDLDALTDYKGATLQYKDVARKIENCISSLKRAASEKAIKSPSADVTVRIGESLSSLP